MKLISPFFRTVRLVRGVRKAYEGTRPSGSRERRVFKIVREERRA